MESARLAWPMVQPKLHCDSHIASVFLTEANLPIKVFTRNSGTQIKHKYNTSAARRFCQFHAGTRNRACLRSPRGRWWARIYSLVDHRIAVRIYKCSSSTSCVVIYIAVFCYFPYAMIFNHFTVYWFNLFKLIYSNWFIRLTCCAVLCR